MNDTIHDKLPSLTGMLHLEAVARAKSFTAAARELHITQSAVSRQIRQLEQELGVVLCERTSTGVSLTPTGLALADSMREAMAHLIDTRDRWCEPAEHIVESGGHITVGMPPTLANHWAIPRLAAFRVAHQGWQLRPDVAISRHDLDTSEVDACVRYGKGGYEGVLWTQLATEQLVAVCTPELWDTLGKELVDAPILQAHTMTSPRGAQPAITWAASCHITLRGTITDFNRQSMAIMAAAQGEGVAIVPFQMARYLVESGALIHPISASCPDQMSYYLVWSATRARPHVITMLHDWLRAELS